MTSPSKAPVAERIDARKLRSREALQEAFLALLREKNLEQISIREISARANIGHATFYRHYTGKDDLLDDLATGEIRRMVNLTLPVMSSDSTGAACRALCDHVFAQQKLWTTLLTGGAAGTLKEELLNLSRGIAAEYGKASSRREFDELKVILAVSAIVETLSWWLRQASPLPAEHIAITLEATIRMHESLHFE